MLFNMLLFMQNGDENNEALQRENNNSSQIYTAAFSGNKYKIKTYFTINYIS